MTYTTIRNWFKYGNEDDPMETTYKEWDSYEKAKAYAFRYSKGLKFANCQIENENGDILFELLYTGEVIEKAV